MKTIISATLIFLTLLQSGCATVFGGGMTACQKHKPAKGEPTRAIRGVALTFDIVLGLFVFEIPTGIDFLTGAVYKPCQYSNANPPPTQSPVSSPAISNTQSGPITTFKVETKLAPSGPYDSLKNFVGSNVQQYVGQELYLNGVSEQLRQYGYRGFIKNYKRDYELNAGNVYKSDKDGYTSSYDAMVGKYFTVLDVIKKPDAANDINNGKIFFLKLQEKQSGDLLYFVYDTSYEFQFPFIVTGYMIKLKERYIGKEYNIGGQHLKCIDVAIEEKYYTVNAILQNNKGEKIPHHIEGLSAYQSNDTAIHNKMPSTANNTKRINFDSINSSYLPEHGHRINFDSINSSNSGNETDAASKAPLQFDLNSSDWGVGEQKIINGNAILRIKGDNDNVAGAIYNITNIGYETFAQIKSETATKATNEMWTAEQKKDEDLAINKNTKGGRVTLYVERITIDEANTNNFTLIIKDASDQKEIYREKFIGNVATYDSNNPHIWWNYGVVDIPVALKGKIHIYIVDSLYNGSATGKVFEFEVSI